MKVRYKGKWWDVVYWYGTRMLISRLTPKKRISIKAVWVDTVVGRNIPLSKSALPEKIVA